MLVLLLGKFICLSLENMNFKTFQLTMKMTLHHVPAATFRVNPMKSDSDIVNSKKIKRIKNNEYNTINE